MVQNIVRKTMRRAIVHFAELEEKKPAEISLMIHTKNDQLLPQYFYTINGEPKMEDDQIKELHFRKEILREKIDLQRKEAMAAQFLQMKFGLFSELFEKHPYNLYLRVTPKNLEATELNIELYYESEFLKTYELEEIFAVN